jgi:hypothetical protein
MEERIVALKETLIKESMEKISKISETGIIKIDISKKIVVELDLNGFYLTEIVSDGETIYLISTTTNGPEIIDTDVRMLDLEEFDYCVTNVLDNLLKEKENARK